MKRTKNQDLIEEAININESLYYYLSNASHIVHELKNADITRTEEERYNVKKLIEELEYYG